MKNIILLAIYMCCFLQAKSQDYKADFEQAFALYQGEIYEIEMEYPKPLSAKR